MPLFFNYTETDFYKRDAMNNRVYEVFPWHLTMLCVAFNLAVYGIGAFLLGRFGIVPLGLYLLYCVWVEARVLTLSCRDCVYYGKRCAFGKGMVCSWLFKRGGPDRFISKTISWLDIAPDMLVSLIPLAAGFILLILDFSWTALILILALIVLSTAGNGFIRGSVACKYCHQREIGCPAEKLFDNHAGKCD